MPFQFASRNQLFLLLFLSLVLGGILAIGLQPTSSQLGLWFLNQLGCSSSPLCELLDLTIFPLVCSFFYFSLPSSPLDPSYHISKARLILMSVLPLLISFIFGFTKPPVSTAGHERFPWEATYWTWIAIPIGEELLFRGWIFKFFQKLFRKTYSPFLPILPLALWGQSIAFSLWHLQNLGQVSSFLVGTQVLYTFFVGIWLGLLRWQTGTLLAPILAHCLLNLVADWKLWFMI